jgi:hypothetical protein
VEKWFIDAGERAHYGIFEAFSSKNRLIPVFPA